MINTDTFLKIGDQHKICEDYVIAGVTKQGNPPLQYIILSDGCSKSDKTEMGARILCYITQQFIRYNFHGYPFMPDDKKMGLWIIHNAEMMARNLGLNRACLDATLMVSWVDWTNAPAPIWNIYIYGDGYVAAKADEGITMMKVDYRPENAPYYLSYELDPARKAAYHQLKVSKIMTYVDENGKYKEEQYAYDGATVDMKNMLLDHTILLASDGFGSFFQDDGPTQPPTIISPAFILPGFINFKGKKGSFLQRRASKELKSLNQKEIFHYDDLSIGAYIYEGPGYDDIPP